MCLNRIHEIIENGNFYMYGGKKDVKLQDKYYLIKLSFTDNEVGNNLILELKNKHNKIILNNFENDIVEFNPIVNQKDVVEEISTEKTSGVDDLLNKMENIDTTNDINVEKIKFYLFVYELENENVYLIRRNFNVKSLNRSILAKLRPAGIFDKIDSNQLLKIDYDIDFIIYQEKIYIFNHISLERIFYLNEEFKEKAEETLKKPIFTLKIDNFEKVSEKLLNNGKYVRRIAKLSDDKNRSTLFIENVNKTKYAISEFELPIVYDDSHEKFKINYNDSSQLDTLVNLMQDSYYKTIIGDDKGEDPTR